MFDTPAPFVALLATLEEAFVAAYLAATQRLAAAGRPQLAEIGGQILGVEAQHRLFGRVMAQQRPANNLCLAPARPGPADIVGAVAEFGCIPTRIATAPVFTFAPYVNR